MGGAIRYSIFPLIAGAIFALGCGVPIPAADVTATAVANQSQKQSVSSELAGQPDTQSVNLLSTTSTDASGATPIATRDATLDAVTTSDAEATPTPTPEPTRAPTATPAPAVAVQSVQAPPVFNGSFADEFLSLLNGVRTGQGMGALSSNSALSAAATNYAAYMGSANFFGHFGPDGSSPRSRIAAAGYGGGYKGEALSAGQPSPQAALNALLASPPHAAILLDPTAIQVGIGYAYQAGSTYTYYWVVVTAVP
jgi:uncharacterized protein YkwD